MVQRFFKLFRSAFIGIGPLSSLEKIYSFHAGHFLLGKEVKKQICMSSLVHGEQGVFVPAVGSQAGLKREPHWFPAAPSECLLAKGVYCWESPSGFVVWDVQSWHLSSFTVFCGVTNLRRGQRTLGPSAAVESLQQDTALGRLALIHCASKKKSLGRMKPFRLQVSTSAERKWERNPVVVQFLLSTGCLILEQHQHCFWLLLERGAQGCVSPVDLHPSSTTESFGRLPEGQHQITSNWCEELILNKSKGWEKGLRCRVLQSQLQSGVFGYTEIVSYLNRCEPHPSCGWSMSGCPGPGSRMAPALQQDSEPFQELHRRRCRAVAGVEQSCSLPA